MINIKVPATSANLGPGFDTFGMALNLYLEVEADLSAGASCCTFHGYGAEVINRQPDQNLILEAMKKVYYRAGINLPKVCLTVKNNIPMGKGMGSSAAAIVAGMWTANCLLGEKYSFSELLQWAVEMEGHADNVVPAATGGVTTAMMYNGQVYYQKINLPEEIKVIIVVPDFILSTEKSRSVLPESVNLQDAVSNLQRACYLLACLHNVDLKNLNIAMDDMIFQPLRKQFIPGFDQVLANARKAGAIGVALSGAGPSIIALTTGNEKEVGQAMYEALEVNGVLSQILYLKPVNTGISYY